jgi:ketosteroid isomerase-like protein
MSTTQQSPVTAVQTFYEALSRGDLDTVRSLMSPDITVDMPGKSPLAGLYSGPDAVIGFLGRMQEIAAGTYRAELRALYTNRDSVVAVHHGTGSNGDKMLDADAALVFEVADDGLVTKTTVYQTQQDDWDDFFR